MPVYVFRCTSCDSTTEKIASAKEHGTEGFKPICCETPMQQIIFPVHGHVRKNPHYICPVTQKPITSWRERANVFAEHDLIDVSDMNMDRVEDSETGKLGGFKNDRTDNQVVDDDMVSAVWTEDPAP